MRDEVLICLTVIMLILCVVILWYSTETASMLYEMYGGNLS